MKPSFIDVLNKRKIWKSFVAYPAASFVILQAVDFFITKYGLNPKMLTLTLILLIGGFIVSVIWNWRHGEDGEQKFTKKERYTYVIVVLITLSYSSYYWLNTNISTPVFSSELLKDTRKLAVLPFENHSTEASLIYLSDGIPENLINRLSNLTNLRVLSRNSSFILEESDRNAAGVQNKLDADLMLIGNLDTVNNNLVVSCQLVDVKDGTQIWGDKIVYENNDIIKLEDNIAASLLLSLPNSIKKQEKPSKTLKSTNPKAQAHYMKGRALSYGSTTEEAEKALNHFREAIEIDPQFVPAYVAIANEKIIQAMFSTATRDEIFNESRMAVQTALALDPSYSQTYVVDGGIKLYGDFNWYGAERSYKKAIELDSLNVDALIRYSAYLVAMKKYKEALEFADKAILLDPISISSLHNLGWVNLVAGNFETSENAFSEALSIHPNWTWGYIKRAYAREFQNKCDLALADLSKARQLVGEWGGELMENSFISVFAGCNQMDMKNSTIDKFFKKVDKFNYHDPVAVSYAHFNKGDLDSFFYWMEKSITEKTPSVYLYNIDVFHENELSNNPRFIELKNRLNFPVN
jgi:TolB-like protein